MKYTQEQISVALLLLKATGSPDAVIDALGYPSKPTLYTWKNQLSDYVPKCPKRKYKGHASNDLKELVIRCCVAGGEHVESVAREIGYSRAIVFRWIQEFRQKGHFSTVGKATTLVIEKYTFFFAEREFVAAVILAR